MKKVKAEKKSLCNLIILDASGSMASKKDEVIGGIKQIFGQVKKDKKLKQHTIVCDFSGAGDFNVLVDTSDVSELTETKAEGYKTRGMTALYDAIGKAFQLVPKSDGVFVSIITDGMENDSKEFTSDALKTLIEEKTKEKWGITFMGTTQEALLSAQGLGIKQGNMSVFENSKKGMRAANFMYAEASMDYGDALYRSVTASDIQTDDLIKKLKKEVVNE